MKMGTKSIPEMLEHSDILKWLPAREDFIECWYDSPITWTQILVEVLYIYIY